MTGQSQVLRRSLLARHPITAYFVIAYAFSWAIGGLLIADYYGLFSVPKAIYYLSAFGPTVGALVVISATEGREGLRDLFGRIVRAAVGVRWWLVAVGMPLAFGVVAILIYWAERGTLPDLQLFGQVDYLGQIGIAAALLLWLATYGFGEEIGWRGFALQRMMSATRWLQPAVLIGVLWSFWHLPYFFFKLNFIALGAGGFVFFTISITLGSIFLSWLYRGSGGSLLIVAVWHALFDFVSASPIAEGTANAVISGLVVAVVITILRTNTRRAQA
jgi:membrane protease YdiL (CAAX protease family)